MMNLAEQLSHLPYQEELSVNDAVAHLSELTGMNDFQVLDNIPELSEADTASFERNGESGLIILCYGGEGEVVEIKVSLESEGGLTREEVDSSLRFEEESLPEVLPEEPDDDEWLYDGGMPELPPIEEDINTLEFNTDKVDEPLEFAQGFNGQFAEVMGDDFAQAA